MASRMQRLNVRLSYILEDVVAAYTDDGQDYLSADRDLFLNTASRILYDGFFSLYENLLNKVKSRSRGDVDPAADILKDFIIAKAVNIVGKPSGGFTDYASGDTHCSGVWLDDYPSGNVNRVKRPLRLALTLSGGSITEIRNYKILSEHDIPLTFTSHPRFQPYPDNPIAYVTFNSAKTAKYLRILPNHTSGTAAKFSWLQYPNTDLTSAGSEDIQWNSMFDTALLRIAFACALNDDGKIPESEALIMSVFKSYNIPADMGAESLKQVARSKP